MMQVKLNNLVIFKFGNSLNLMAKIIDGIIKSKGDKKTLVLTSNIVINLNGKMSLLAEVAPNTIETLKQKNLLDYKMIILEGEYNKKIEELASSEEYKDLVFLCMVKENKEFNEDLVTYCDLENLDKLPMFKKIAKLNEVRKKLSTNKATKKWKIFK